MWDVETRAERLFEGEGLDEGEKLGDGVRLGAAEREGCASRGDFGVHHELESAGQVDAVCRAQLRAAVVYVPGDRPAWRGRASEVSEGRSITPMRAALTSHLVEESVLMSVEAAWPDDRSPIEGLLDELLPLGL